MLRVRHSAALLVLNQVVMMILLDLFWGHDSGVGGVDEIARATNLGATGWNDFQEYVFDFY